MRETWGKETRAEEICEEAPAAEVGAEPEPPPMPIETDAEAPAPPADEAPVAPAPPAEDEPLAPELPPEEPPEELPVAPQSPVGSPSLESSSATSTWSPGFGYLTSMPSAMVHELMLLSWATNMSGYESRPEPPFSMVTIALRGEVSR